MKSKGKIFSLLLMLLLSISTLTLPAAAEAKPPADDVIIYTSDPTEPPPTTAPSTKPTTAATKPTEAPEPTTAPTTAPTTPTISEPFEQGNAIASSLQYHKDTNKQFLTIETRSGEVFYIIIDYDAPVNENLEQFSAYFLNKVDNADLSALLDDGNTVEVCGCIDRCYAGHVNTTCPICAKNMTECVGKEPETTEVPTTAPTEPVKEPEKKSNPAGLLLVLLILGMGGAVAWHFFKNKMPDQQTKGDTDLDDYDYGIDEDDDLDYDTEDEQEEQH